MFNLQQRSSEPEQQLIDAAKKNCTLCMGRSRLRPTDKEKQAALAAVRELKLHYEQQFNSFRKQDSDATSIQNALQNKRKCLDAIDACNSCDKQVDRIARMVKELK